MTQDNLEPTVVFPYINYKGYLSTREAKPVSIIYDADNEYHGEGFILKGFDTDREDIRDFSFKDIIRGAYYQAILDLTTDTALAKHMSDAYIFDLENQLHDSL